MPTPDSTAPLPSIDSMLRLILTSRVYDVCARPRSTRRRACPPARLRGAAQARGSAAGLQLQAARRLQPHGAPHRGRTRARRHRRQRRQSRAGRRLSARKLGIHAVIVMPETTPEIKVDAVRGLGAEVVLPATLRGRQASSATKLQRQSGAIAHPPVRRPAGDCGPGHRSARRLCASASATWRPCSSPSAAAGSSRASPATSRRCGPTSRIIGVEPFEADAMYRSLQAGRRVTLDHVGIFADGVAVREVGVHTFAIAQRDGRRGGARDQRRDLRRDQGRLRRHPERSWSRPARCRSPASRRG